MMGKIPAPLEPFKSCEQATVELPKSKKKTTICSVKRVLLGILILSVVACVCGLVIAFCYISELNDEIKQQNEFHIRNTAHELTKLNDTKNSWHRFTVKMTDIQNEIDRLRQMNTGNRPTPKTGTDLRQKFNEISDQLNSLISTVGNLSATLAKLNVSSESKMSHLQRNFNDTRNDLIRLQNEVTYLSYSLHTDMAHFNSSIVSAVQDLRQELLTLSNSTSTKVNELWKHWNRTDEEIDDIVNLMSQQNETFHFKIAYHSDALKSELKDVQENQLKFHNYTINTVKQLRSDLSNTQESLQMYFNDEISQVNKSWHEAIKTIDGNLRLSVVKINAKVDGIKKHFETNINDVLKTQKEMKDDFSETKTKLQEKDRKHDSAISGEKSKMEGMEERVKDLEEELDSKTRKQGQEMEKLKNRVENIENAANGFLENNIELVILSLITASIIHLN